MSIINATLEEAQRMKNAGANKDTFFFYAKRIKTGTYHLCSIMQYEDNGSTSSFYSYSANKIMSQYEFEENTIPAYTLGEIELPEGFSIVCWSQKEGWLVLCANDEEIQYRLWCELPNDNYFKTELSARIHAWIYAKENNLFND